MIKQYFVDGLMQLAIVLSLLRTDVSNYFNRDYINYPEIQEIVLGQTFGYAQTNFHANIQNRFEHFTVHPKNHINGYDIYAFLRGFRAFERPQTLSTNINAFLADHETRPSHVDNIVTPAGASLPVIHNNQVDTQNDSEETHPETDSDDVLSSMLRGNELTKEDMDLIDVLWRQDIDLGVGREFFDVDLRQELEREREIELHKQRIQEYELELQQYKTDEQRGHNAQHWLTHNYFQDGETGEYIPLPEGEPYNVDSAGFTSGDTQEFTFEEAFAILDRMTSSTPPEEPPSLDDFTSHDPPLPQTFGPERHTFGPDSYPDFPPPSYENISRAATSSQNYSGNSATPHTITSNQNFSGNPANTGNEIYNRVNVTELLPRPNNTDNDLFIQSNNPYIQPIQSESQPDLANSLLTHPNNPYIQPIQSESQPDLTNSLLTHPNAIFGNNYNFTTDYPPPLTATNFTPSDNLMPTLPQFNAANLTFPTYANLTNTLDNQPEYLTNTNLSQFDFSQSTCPVLRDSPVLTNQTFTNPHQICEIDKFDDIDTGSANLTNSNFDQFNLQQLSNATTNSPSAAVVPDQSEASPTLSLDGDWSRYFSLLDLPTSGVSSDVTPGLISNASMSSLSYYDNATAALASASSNNYADDTSDVGIADCFKFINSLSPNADADYLSTLGGNVDDMTPFNIMDINIDEELDDNEAENKHGDVSDDSAVSLGSHSPGYSHTTDLADISTLRSESPYDDIVGATGGSDYDSDRKRMKSESSDYSSQSYSTYEGGYDQESNFSSNSSESGRGSLERGLHHNHTYPVNEDIKPRDRQKKKNSPTKNSDDDEAHQTRDEKNIEKLKLPHSAGEIIGCSVDEFNDMLSKTKLTKSQAQTYRDIRRRGKNKIAAQNCRKRKVDEIFDLGDDLSDLQEKRDGLIHEQQKMDKERRELKREYDKMYEAVFRSLRDANGTQYDPDLWCLEETGNGELVVTRRRRNFVEVPPLVEVKTHPKEPPPRKRKRDET